MEPDFYIPRILNLGRIPDILFQTQLVDTSHRGREGGGGICERKDGPAEGAHSVFSRYILFAETPQERKIQYMTGEECSME